MQEILREALILGDPKAVKEEVVDPKAKGKGPAKTPGDVVVAEASEELTHFKEIGHLLLQQV
jgi:hypothetical protein